MHYEVQQRVYRFYTFTRLDSEIINVQHNGTILLEALYIELIINLPLYYATLSTCIAGTSLHQTQL